MGFNSGFKGLTLYTHPFIPSVSSAKTVKHITCVSYKLIDLHWVRALMVPMHLGLIDGPFVPHKLILAQESPVPLPKFQMVPRLKNLNVFWVQERNPDILFFSVNSPGKRIPSRFPNGAPSGAPNGERCPYPEPFLTYLPGSPVKEPSPKAHRTEPLQR